MTRVNDVRSRLDEIKERKMMAGKIASSPQTCPADDVSSKCGASDEWEGEFFPGIPKIKYEGPSSKNPLSYKWYNADEEILGKKMKDWMRFSVAFWHTFRGTGGDPFGAPTKFWPWEDGTDSLAMAKRRMRANFEFIEKLGVDLWCFHDRDIAPDEMRGMSVAYMFEFLERMKMEANANLDEVVALAKELQERDLRVGSVIPLAAFLKKSPFLMPEKGTKFNLRPDTYTSLASLQGKKIHPLWGTAQLFHHPRYMHGGATSSEVAVYAYAAAQVKKAMEVTHYLGGENYVFWGGREGYQTLLNTDMGRELDHLARFLEAAAAYKKKIGFNGTLLIEPKPQEPTKHQYDWDAATTANFLRKYGLIGLLNLSPSSWGVVAAAIHVRHVYGSKMQGWEFKLNIECNHATLSGHRLNGLLGNIDANTGDPQIGWDTDQFLTDIAEATMVMLRGLAPGGFNFDAKLRRESTDVEDLFISHISGMDTLARALCLPLEDNAQYALMQPPNRLVRLILNAREESHGMGRAKGSFREAGTCGDDIPICTVESSMGGIEQFYFLLPSERAHVSQPFGYGKY
ncbi:Xylose isomerase [Vitis vinifera]|uniref:xylose isomerase n=2 Tax=rosids TaxID=71275 RepID=A0A438H5T7_VITVI|nr:Xylose isomerase [Vitis vinifera]